MSEERAPYEWSPTVSERDRILEMEIALVLVEGYDLTRDMAISAAHDILDRLYAEYVIDKKPYLNSNLFVELAKRARMVNGRGL